MKSTKLKSTSRSTVHSHNFLFTHGDNRSSKKSTFMLFSIVFVFDNKASPVCNDDDDDDDEPKIFQSISNVKTASFSIGICLAKIESRSLELSLIIAKAFCSDNLLPISSSNV